MRAGCSEVLLKPITDAQLREALERIQVRHASSLALPWAPGKIITVGGAKGGVGTTTLAVHLASYLANRHGRRTLLLDLRRQLGHVCLYLGMKEPKYHFEDLLRNVDRLDGEMLRGFVTRHASGLHVIGAPERCASQRQLSLYDVEQIFDLLRREYDSILLDASLGEEAAPFLRVSDMAYLVATPSLGSIRDLSRYLHAFELPDAQSPRVRVVVNRVGPHAVLGKADIQKAIGMPVHFEIPEDTSTVVPAMDEGEPLPHTKRSPFVARMVEWASEIAGEKAAPAAPAVKKASLWRTSRPEAARCRILERCFPAGLP